MSGNDEFRLTPPAHGREANRTGLGARTCLIAALSILLIGWLGVATMVMNERVASGGTGAVALGVLFVVAIFAAVSAVLAGKDIRRARANGSPSGSPLALLIGAIAVIVLSFPLTVGLLAIVSRAVLLGPVGN